MRRLRIAYFYTPLRLHRIPGKQYIFDNDIRREKIRRIFERPRAQTMWNLDRESRKKEVAKRLAEWDNE